MKITKRLLTLLLCAVLLLGVTAPALAASDLVKQVQFTVKVDGGKETKVRACYASYNGNLYLSLTDLSAALSGSRSNFSFAYQYTSNDGEYWEIKTGHNALSNAGTQGVGSSWLDCKRNRLFVDGKERRYYTYRDGKDLYMNFGDTQLLLNVYAEMEGVEAAVYYAGEPFRADLTELDAAGYFDYYTGICVGDAATGEILYRRNYFSSTSVASTSKLMTYLLVMEAADRGEIKLTDKVKISAYAAKVSNSQDGTISMTEGEQVPMQELLQALLLASSNEAAVALAEHVSGSEEAFVETMNTRAQEMGIYSAVFYNPNGLPFYTGSRMNAKLQNRMSARDMFKLSAFILQNYPQITDITDLDFCTMPTLSYTTANSNPLVFNMPEVDGLKTGSTNRAGYCLVASMPLTVNGETHELLAVVLGAENAADRGQAAEILLRAAAAHYTETGFGGEETA